MVGSRVPLFALGVMYILLYCQILQPSDGHILPENERSLLQLGLNASSPARKFIVAEPEGGLGNRISGLISACYLAYITGRVAVIDWKSSATHPSEFKDLFSKVEQTYGKQTVIYSLDSLYDDTLPKNVNECALELTEHNSYVDFWALLDYDIYKLLDKNCDVIRIRTNQLFLEILEKSAFARDLLPVSERKFKYPFGQILNRILQPNAELKHKINHFVKHSVFGGGLWLSIHSRGLLDPTGQLTLKSIDCANHLLKTGMIRYIFFSSESERLTDLVENSVKPPGALISLEKKFENLTVNSLETANEHVKFIEHGTTALEEWYIMGQADYCMIVTPKSAFSTTSLMRTSCKYIPVMQGGNCSVEDKVFHVKPKNMLVIEQPKEGSKKVIDVDKFWSRIPRRMVAVNFAPILKTTIQDIRLFWEARQTEPLQAGTT